MFDGIVRSVELGRNWEATATVEVLGKKENATALWGHYVVVLSVAEYQALKDKAGANA